MKDQMSSRASIVEAVTANEVFSPPIGIRENQDQLVEPRLLRNQLEQKNRKQNSRQKKGDSTILRRNDEISKSRSSRETLLQNSQSNLEDKIVTGNKQRQSVFFGSFKERKQESQFGMMDKNLWSTQKVKNNQPKIGIEIGQISNQIQFDYRSYSVSNKGNYNGKTDNSFSNSQERIEIRSGNPLTSTDRLYQVKESVKREDDDFKSNLQLQLKGKDGLISYPSNPLIHSGEMDISEKPGNGFEQSKKFHQRIKFTSSMSIIKVNLNLIESGLQFSQLPEDQQNELLFEQSKILEKIDQIDKLSTVLLTHVNGVGADQSKISNPTQRGVTNITEQRTQNSVSHLQNIDSFAAPFYQIQMVEEQEQQINEGQRNMINKSLMKEEILIKREKENDKESNQILQPIHQVSDIEFNHKAVGTDDLENLMDTREFNQDELNEMQIQMIEIPLLNQNQQREKTRMTTGDSNMVNPNHYNPLLELSHFANTNDLQGTNMLNFIQKLTKIEKVKLYQEQLNQAYLHHQTFFENQRNRVEQERQLDEIQRENSVQTRGKMRVIVSNQMGKNKVVFVDKHTREGFDFNLYRDIQKKGLGVLGEGVDVVVGTGEKCRMSTPSLGRQLHLYHKTQIQLLRPRAKRNAKSLQKNRDYIRKNIQMLKKIGSELGQRGLFLDQLVSRESRNQSIRDKLLAKQMTEYLVERVREGSNTLDSITDPVLQNYLHIRLEEMCKSENQRWDQPNNYGGSNFSTKLQSERVQTESSPQENIILKIGKEEGQGVENGSPQYMNESPSKLKSYTPSQSFRLHPQLTHQTDHAFYRESLSDLEQTKQNRHHLQNVKSQDWRRSSYKSNNQEHTSIKVSQRKPIETGSRHDELVLIQEPSKISLPKQVSQFSRSQNRQTYPIQTYCRDEEGDMLEGRRENNLEFVEDSTPKKQEDSRDRAGDEVVIESDSKSAKSQLDLLQIQMVSRKEFNGTLFQFIKGYGKKCGDLIGNWGNSLKLSKQNTKKKRYKLTNSNSLFWKQGSKSNISADQPTADVQSEEVEENISMLRSIWKLRNSNLKVSEDRNIDSYRLPTQISGRAMRQIVPEEKTNLNTKSEDWDSPERNKYPGEKMAVNKVTVKLKDKTPVCFARNGLTQKMSKELQKALKPSSVASSLSNKMVVFNTNNGKIQKPDINLSQSHTDPTFNTEKPPEFVYETKSDLKVFSSQNTMAQSKKVIEEVEILQRLGIISEISNEVEGFLASQNCLRFSNLLAINTKYKNEDFYKTEKMRQLLRRKNTPQSIKHRRLQQIEKTNLEQQISSNLKRSGLTVQKLSSNSVPRTRNNEIKQSQNKRIYSLLDKVNQFSHPTFNLLSVQSFSSITEFPPTHSSPLSTQALGPIDQMSRKQQLNYPLVNNSSAQLPKYKSNRSNNVCSTQTSNNQIVNNNILQPPSIGQIGLNKRQSHFFQSRASFGENHRWQSTQRKPGTSNMERGRPRNLMLKS